MHLDADEFLSVVKISFDKAVANGFERRNSRRENANRNFKG
jgi:hypothetical protein